MKIHKYLKASNFFAIFLSSIIGAIVSSQEFLLYFLNDKYLYAFVLIITFFIFNFWIEFRVLRELRRRGCHLQILFFGNPLLKTSLFRFGLLIFGGYVVITRYELDTTLSYIFFSVLVAFFVGGTFEAYRLLNRSL